MIDVFSIRAGARIEKFESGIQLSGPVLRARFDFESVDKVHDAKLWVRL